MLPSMSSAHQLLQIRLEAAGVVLLTSTEQCMLALLCSTIVGDIAEVKAIKKVFTDTKNIKMNATKSMIGHCLGAAAGIEAIAVVKAIQTGWLHPTLNQYNLVEEVEGIDTVPFEKKQHKVSRLTAALEMRYQQGVSRGS